MTQRIELSDAARHALEHVSTATLTSQLLKRGFRNTFIFGMLASRPDLRMVGYAYTLRYVPSREDVGFDVDYDNRTDVQRIAVESIGAGDVLVVDARESTRSASFGHILATRIARRGAAGLVTDGCLRDSPSFVDLALPTYSHGAHATTSSVAHFPADVNVPIGCAGVLVMPNDIVVGDREGVVVVPAAIADEVALDAAAQDQLEEYSLERVAAGESIVDVYPLAASESEAYARWLAGKRHQ